MNKTFKYQGARNKYINLEISALFLSACYLQGGNLANALSRLKESKEKLSQTEKHRTKQKTDIFI